MSIGTMITGNFADGITSRQTPASLTSSDGKITICAADGKVLAAARPADIDISSRLGNTPRTFTFNNGATFETDDNDAVDTLLGGGRSNLLYMLENHSGFIAIAALAALGIVFWVITTVIPYGSERLAYKLPDELVAQIGSGSLKIIDKFLDPTKLTEQQQARVRKLLEPHIGKGNFSLHFRDAPPNAMALPNGAIVFTDGLIELAENDEELIAVAYHEIGHLQQRHIIRHSLQNSAIIILLFLLTGDVSNMDILTTIPATLTTLSYSRQFELEADRFALTELQAQGIDIIHYKNILQRLDQYYGESSEETDGPSLLNYLSTHPHTSERLELVDSYLK